MKTVATKIRLLPCHLSEDEVNSKGKELAQLYADITQEEVRQKEVKNQLKKELSRLQTRIGALSNQIRTQSEERNVEVDIMMDDLASVIKEVRRDTAEIINTRAPNESERQTSLFEDGD